METLLIFIAIALLNAVATWMKAQKKRQQKQAGGHGKTANSGKAQPAKQASAAGQKPHREQTELPDLVRNILEQIGMENPPPVPEAAQEDDLSLDEKKEQAKIRRQRMQTGSMVEKKQPAFSKSQTRTALERKVEEQNLRKLNGKHPEPMFEEGVSDFEAMSEEQLRERELIYTGRQAETPKKPERISKKKRRQSSEAREKLRQGLTWAVILGTPRAHRKSPLHQGPGKVQ